METLALEPIYALDIKIHDLFVENRLSLLSLLKIKIRGFDALYIKLPPRNLNSPHIYTIVLESEYINHRDEFRLNDFSFSSFKGKSFSYLRHNTAKLKNLIDNNNEEIFCGALSLLTSESSKKFEDRVEEITDISVNIFFDRDDMKLICFGEKRLTDCMYLKHKERVDEELPNFITSYAEYLEPFYFTDSPIFIPLFYPPASESEEYPIYAGEIPISICIYKLNDDILLQRFLEKENFASEKASNRGKQESSKEEKADKKNEEVNKSIVLPDFPKYKKNFNLPVGKEQKEEVDYLSEELFDGEWLIDSDEEHEQVEALEDDSVDEFVNNFNQKGIKVLRKEVHQVIHEPSTEESFIENEFMVEVLDNSYYDDSPVVEKPKRPKSKKGKKHRFGAFVFPPPKHENIIRWKI